MVSYGINVLDMHKYEVLILLKSYEYFHYKYCSSYKKLYSKVAYVLLFNSNIQYGVIGKIRYNKNVVKQVKEILQKLPKHLVPKFAKNAILSLRLENGSRIITDNIDSNSIMLGHTLNYCLVSTFESKSNITDNIIHCLRPSMMHTLNDIILDVNE
jgi:hypothetical protein